MAPQMVPECYEDNNSPVMENPFLRPSSYQWHLLSEQWSTMTSLLGGHFSQIKKESWAKLKTLFLVPALPISCWLASMWWSLPLSGPPSPLNADTLGRYRADLPYSLGNNPKALSVLPSSPLWVCCIPEPDHQSYCLTCPQHSRQSGHELMALAYGTGGA